MGDLPYYRYVESDGPFCRLTPKISLRTALWLRENGLASWGRFPLMYVSWGRIFEWHSFAPRMVSHGWQNGVEQQPC